jgi:hypothetical protein
METPPPRTSYEEIFDRATPEELAAYRVAMKEIAARFEWGLGRWPASEVISDVGGDGEPDESSMIPVEGTDLWVRARQQFVIAGGDLPYLVTIEVGFDGTTARCVSARFTERDGGEAVSSTRIRDVPLQRLARAAAASHARTFRRMDDGRFVRTLALGRTYERKVRAGEAALRRRTPDSELAEVARIYLQALAAGAHPTAAVEQGMRLANRNTAKKWVRRARASGHLPPAPGPRRAGVVPTSSTTPPKKERKR